MVRGPMGRGASARYQVLSAVLLKIQVFCTVTRCRLLNTDISGGTKRLCVRGKVIRQDSTSPNRRKLPADMAWHRWRLESWSTLLFSVTYLCRNLRRHTDTYCLFERNVDSYLSNYTASNHGDCKLDTALLTSDLVVSCICLTYFRCWESSECQVGLPTGSSIGWWGHPPLPVWPRRRAPVLRAVVQGQPWVLPVHAQCITTWPSLPFRGNIGGCKLSEGCSNETRSIVILGEGV